MAETQSDKWRMRFAWTMVIASTIGIIGAVTLPEFLPFGWACLGAFALFLWWLGSAVWIRIEQDRLLSEGLKRRGVTREQHDNIMEMWRRL